MNKITTAIFLLFTTYLLSQTKESFEGIINYNNVFESKVDSISNESLLSAYGKETKYLLSKNGDYINLFKGTYITIQLYKKNELKLYTLLTKRDTIFYNDVREEVGVLKNLNTKSSKKENVLDYICKTVSFQLNNTKYTYYYSDEIYVDSTLFTKHNFGKWNKIVAFTNAIPLKVVVENDLFVMQSTAIKIKKGKVNKRLFSLPPNSPIKKAGSNLFIN